MKVKKSAKKQSPPPADAAALADRITTCPESDLASLLSSFDQWRFPRGDLHAWVAVLDRFDTILADTITGYDLTKPQINDFTPRTKDLVLQILRVQRLLLENCTNRKLFASYDRIIDFLLTSDYDVLQATLYLLLRPAQQYGSQAPFEAGQAPIITSRLLALGKWESDQGPTFSVTFYPSDPVTLDLDATLSPDDLVSLVEQHQMPLEIHFLALNRLRRLAASPSDMEKLVVIRQLALSTYLFIVREETANSSLFLYQPDLVSAIAATPTAWAIYALDACAHHRSKLQEVINTLTIPGIINVFREASRNPEPAMIDALISFVAYISGSATHSNMLIGAGILSVLLDFLSTESPRRDSYIPRVTGLIDTLLYSNPQALPAFSNADGVNKLVHRIKAELKPPSPPISDIFSRDTMVFSITQPLRSILRSIHRLMQSSGGTEPLRNLVDSELPRCVMSIFESHERFGPRVFATAINIMATFVHNEPTSLAIIQEQKLPQTLYAQLTPLPNSFDVIAAIPTAMGAICLNQAGLELTTANESILTNVVASVTTLDDLDGDNCHQLGSSLDELGRHHPALRPAVLNATKKTIASIDSLQTLDKVTRFLDGMMHNGVACRDFVEDGGLDLLLQCLDGAYMPQQFFGQPALVSLSHLFRTIGEHDHVKLVDTLVRSVQSAKDRCPDLCTSTEAWSRDLPEQFAAMRSLSIRLALLSESLLGLAWTHSRVSVSLIKAFLPVVNDLGTLHRIAFAQHVTNKSAPDAPPATVFGADEAAASSDKLATRVHAFLTKLFKSVIKLMQTKRTPDGAHKQQASQLADAIATILIGHLETATSTPLATVALGLVTILLFDDRGPDGLLNLTLYHSFVKKGGLATLMASIDSLVEAMNASDARTETTGGLRIGLSTLAGLTSPKSYESPHPPPELTQLFLQTRLMLFPLCQRIWSADWLPETPAPIIKLSAKALLAIMAANSEDQAESVTIAAPQPPPAADPGRVDQLVDMGFARDAAEYALLRARNNVAAAADLILSMPHLFQDIPPQPVRAEAPSEDVEPAETSEPEQETSIESLKVQLDQLRDDCRKGLASRAIALLDRAEDLVFDLLPAIPQGPDGITFLLGRVAERPDDAALSARLRILGVLLRDDVALETLQAQHAIDILQDVPANPAAPYLPALLLCAEAICASGSQIAEAKLGESPATAIVEQALQMPGLQQVCLDTLSNVDASRDNVVAALRMLVVLGRQHSVLDVRPLLVAFKDASAQRSGVAGYLSIILRHSFEDPVTLRQTMRREIAEWFAPQKTTDIAHFVRQLRQAALRDPDAFIRAVNDECILVDPSPASSVYHIRSKEEKQAQPPSDPFGDSGPQTHPVMQALVAELHEAITSANTAYAGLLLSILTELLGSYIPAKTTFTACIRQHAFSKTRTGLASVVNDLISGTPLRNPSESAKSISAWATSLLVALCADIAPSQDIKEIPEELVTTRKAVLDVLSKALKDTSATDLDARYGRLAALGELICRLLDRSRVGPRRDESAVHMAKTMLEKNFVPLLTAAIGEIDLNYPDVRAVLVSLLKALEQLSKMSAKWSKADKPKPAVIEAASDYSEDSDVEMSDGEAPDPHRFSSLGIMGGDMEEEDDYDEEDEDDEEEDMMTFGDDIMDEEMDEDTDPSTEDPDEDLDSDGWVDEDDDEDDEDNGGEMEEIPDAEDDALVWENDAEQERESLISDDEGGFQEEVAFFDDEVDEGDENEDMDMDEEEYDEIDMLEPLPSLEHEALPTSAAGHWGWQTNSGPPERGPARRSRLLDVDPTSALFGMPRVSPPVGLAPHPLLAQPSPSVPRRFPRAFQGGLTELLAALEGAGGQRATQMFENLLAQTGQGGHEAVRISLSQADDGGIGLTIGGRTISIAQPTPTSRNDSSLESAPMPTLQRWHEELAIVPTRHNERLARLTVHLTNRLLPDARKRAEETAEQARQEAAQIENVDAAAVALPESRDSPNPAIDDVEMNVPPVEPPAASESLARTVITIHDREVDITDTGIDLEFLQALPDDMRADVVDQHLREQNRHRAPAQIPDASSQISPEFLDALPPEIRAEVIMQEAIESARRARPEPAVQPAPPPPVASRFLDGLNSDLRAVMLMGPGGSNAPASVGVPASSGPKAHREALQLLDRPGIASLVRLLFFPESESLRRGHLFRVLVNLCENTMTRADLLGLLLSVIQDGSGDLPAVDKSFQQMSLRAAAAATPKTTPKAKVAETPAPNPSTLFLQLQTDQVPTFIAQRCFDALSYIVGANQQAVTYFLTEHEQAVGLKKTNKKGKNKVLPQTKYPIVILLGLLDREVLFKTTGMMESLTSLLATITKPIMSSKPNDDSVDKLPAVPVIPPNILRLVINCLTDGDCSSRTFSHTLVIMQHLAALPEAKDVFLQELQSRSAALGSVIRDELIELCDHLRVGDKLKTTSLATFLAPTSSQAQLLRLLKTIDFLHLNKVDPDPPGETMSDAEKAVGKMYESFDFDPMWRQLGDTLSLVASGDNTDQVASALLPLVEALMVVCKYRGRSTREFRSPSIPPSSVDPEDLFVSFTSAHRQVLNAIVRNNPSLLSGSFSLLVRNPRVLDFDNKRNWFFQKLKRKRDQPQASGVLHLNVRRQYVFEDSFRALGQRTGEEVKYGKLSVKFHNEDGIDAGGVTREWYSVLAQQIFDPNFALFEPCAADQQTYQPNKASSVNEQHLSLFKFIGRIIGKAVYDGRLLDAYFNRAFYKQILGRTVDMRDLESIDPEYHKSLQWMLDNDITGVIDQEFTIEDEEFGEKKTVELREGGSKIPVTEENKEDYVRLVVSYRLDNSIKDQVKAFLEGFYGIIPHELIQIFEPDQLELLISGITTIDVDELKNATQMSGWKPSDPEIGWFWRALRSFTQEERARFLMFVTSSSRVPLGGFTQLQGASGIQPFQIQKLYAKEGSLPQASTCFNLLLLPKYESYEQLREKLQYAVVETGGFGKA